MKIELVGFAPVDFTDPKDSQKQIQGTKIYYIFDDVRNENLIGMSVDSQFLNKKLASKHFFEDMLTKPIDAVFDNKGKITDFIAIV